MLVYIPLYLPLRFQGLIYPEALLVSLSDETDSDVLDVRLLCKVTNRVYECDESRLFEFSPLIFNRILEKLPVILLNLRNVSKFPHGPRLHYPDTLRDDTALTFIQVLNLHRGLAVINLNYGFLH